MSKTPSRLRARRRMLLLVPFLTVSALAVAVLGFAFIQGDVGAAGVFSPQVSAELSDDEVLANANTKTVFKIPSENFQYKKFFSFTPEEFFPLDRTVDPAIGATTGSIKAAATLGLLNGACGTTLPVTIPLKWCSADTSDTLANFDDQFKDVSPANGIPDGCDHYPEFLTRIAPGPEPIERHFGWVSVSGQKVSLSIAYFEPGSFGFSDDWGMVGVTILNDIGDTAGEPTPDAITDFCAPLDTEINLNGLAGDGAEVRRNPSCSDTFSFRWSAESMPNSDGDGYENYLDTCPFVDNIDPSPRTGAGDPDGDGIDGACEPAGGIGVLCWPGYPGSGDDCDGDGYQNRGDNCPLVANGTISGPNNQADSDGDLVGDACDDPAFPPTTAKAGPPALQVDIEITGGSACSAGTPTPTPVATAVGTATPTPTPAAAVTLAAAVAAGANQITVTDASGFAVGDSVTIGSGATAETCEITAISGSTLTLDCTLEFAHAAGEAVVKAAEGTPTATPPPGPEGICGISFPGTYNGLARLNGVPASGYVVTVKVGGEPWGSAVVTGGRYAVDVPDHPPATEPCFPPEAGTAIVFEINGATCTTTPATDKWTSGLNNVDLSCAAAATPAPGTPAPGTPVPGTPKPTATPAKPPPTGGGGLGGDQDLPLWAMVLAGWAGLTALAGLGTLATRIVKR